MSLGKKIPLSLMPKLRFLRVARDFIAKPTTDKKGVNHRSLNYIGLLLSDKSRSLLFASYPSSGWNWSIDIMSYCLGKSHLGKFQLEYDPTASSLKEAEIKPFRLFYPADSRAAGGNKANEIFPTVSVDYCFHTHGYWGESPLFGIDKAKTILIKRDPFTALYSHYAKKQQVYEDFGSFLTETRSLERICRFYNSWNLYRLHYPNSYNEFSYEAFKQAPVESFSILLEKAFGLNIDTSIVTEAIDYYSFEKQKDRELAYTSKEDSHFHFQGKMSYRDRIDPVVYKKISKYLKQNLVYDFGYEL